MCRHVQPDGGTAAAAALLRGRTREAFGNTQCTICTDLSPCPGVQPMNESGTCRPSAPEPGVSTVARGRSFR
jgi:hypothetical protein